MTEREFKEAKLAALEKVMPYFMAPDRFSLPKMTLEETALLMSKGPDGIMSKSVGIFLSVRPGFSLSPATSVRTPWALQLRGSSQTGSEDLSSG